MLLLLPLVSPTPLLLPVLLLLLQILHILLTTKANNYRVDRLSLPHEHISKSEQGNAADTLESDILIYDHTADFYIYTLFTDFQQ